MNKKFLVLIFLLLIPSCGEAFDKKIYFYCGIIEEYFGKVSLSRRMIRWDRVEVWEENQLKLSNKKTQKINDRFYISEREVKHGFATFWEWSVGEDRQVAYLSRNHGDTFTCAYYASFFASVHNNTKPKRLCPPPPSSLIYQALKDKTVLESKIITEDCESREGMPYKDINKRNKCLDLYVHPRPEQARFLNKEAKADEFYLLWQKTRWKCLKISKWKYIKDGLLLFILNGLTD